MAFKSFNTFVMDRSPAGWPPAQDGREMRSFSSVLVAECIVPKIAGPDIKNQAECRSGCLLEEFNRSCAVSLDNYLSMYFVVPFQHEFITLAPHPLPVPRARSCAVLCTVSLKVQCTSALSFTLDLGILWEVNQLAPGEFAAIRQEQNISQLMATSQCFDSVSCLS